MPTISGGKAGWILQSNDDPHQNSAMPEIAESVVSREEEDFEENDYKVHGIGTSLNMEKKYNSSFMVMQSEDLTRP